MTIKGVTIGDKFTKGKNIKCEVIDFWEVKSCTKKICELYNPVFIIKTKPTNLA